MLPWDAESPVSCSKQQVLNIEKVCAPVHCFPYWRLCYLHALDLLPPPQQNGDRFVACNSKKQTARKSQELQRLAVPRKPMGSTGEVIDVNTAQHRAAAFTVSFWSFQCAGAVCQQRPAACRAIFVPEAEKSVSSTQHLDHAAVQSCRRR